MCTRRTWTRNCSRPRGCEEVWDEGTARAKGKWKRTESGSKLTELKKKARAGMEWDGRGSAMVLIKEKGEKKRKHARDEDVHTVLPEVFEEED